MREGEVLRNLSLRRSRQDMSQERPMHADREAALSDGHIGKPRAGILHDCFPVAATLWMMLKFHGDDKRARWHCRGRQAPWRNLHPRLPSQLKPALELRRHEIASHAALHVEPHHRESSHLSG